MALDLGFWLVNVGHSLTRLDKACKCLQCFHMFLHVPCAVMSSQATAAAHLLANSSVSALACSASFWLRMWRESVLPETAEDWRGNLALTASVLHLPQRLLLVVTRSEWRMVLAFSDLSAAIFSEYLRVIPRKKWCWSGQSALLLCGPAQELGVFQHDVTLFPKEPLRKGTTTGNWPLSSRARLVQSQQNCNQNALVKQFVVYISLCL